MGHVDGNMLAGALGDFFAFDATAARTRCAGCGALDVLAAAMVYPDAPGTVVRCAHCDHVLGTIVDAGDRVWVSLAGIAAIEVRRDGR